MSSFVIEKEQYTHAAAFLGAVVETKNYYREPVLRMWNKRKGRIYTAEDVRADFMRLYKINAAAVAEQYNDPQPESDSATYDGEYTASKAEAVQLMRSGYTMERCESREQLKRTTYRLINFLSSVRYQIEGDEYERRALRIMNKYYRGLYDLLLHLDGIPSDDVKSWGDFSVTETDE